MWWCLVLWMCMCSVNKNNGFLTRQGIHLNQAHPGYSKWKQKHWPQLPVMRVCVGLAWRRPGHNHSLYTGRVESITDMHTKAGLTQHFDPEKHMCTHRWKRTQACTGNTSSPLVGVQENQLCKPTNAHGQHDGMSTNTVVHDNMYTWIAMKWSVKSYLLVCKSNLH